MPGQLITVNHPSAAYERVGKAGRENKAAQAQARNGTVKSYGKRSMLESLLPTLLATRQATLLL